MRRSLAEWAAALTRIRDGRLYLEADYGTFDDYCTDRLRFGRGRADQIIGAGRTLAALPTNVGSRLNEAQVRALGPVAHDPALMERIIDAATIGNGKLTAAAITTEVARHRTDEIKDSLANLRDLTNDLIAWGASHLADEIDRVMGEMIADPTRREELHLELEHVLDGHQDNIREAEKLMAAGSITFAGAYRIAAAEQQSHTHKFLHTVTLAGSAITRLRAEGRHGDAERLADGILADVDQRRDEDGRYGPSNIPSHLLNELFSEVAR